MSNKIDDPQAKLHLGDCLEVLKTLKDNSVDAIVTDPPAGIAFMGKDWDKDKGGRDNWIKWMQEIATECLRVIKPGGHAFVWAIPRTSHWTATAWENAGFEIRDVVAHVYGSGFPKSLDVSKAIDKAAGAEREVVGKKYRVGDHSKAIENYGWRESGGTSSAMNTEAKDIYETAPATEAAKQWEGWGTALKPAREDWLLLRKPISEKTVAANCLKWGTGGINIDESRVGTDGATKRSKQADYPKNEDGTEDRSGSWARTGHDIVELNLGRWPANLIHDNSEEVKECFPETKGKIGMTGKTGKDNSIYGKYAHQENRTEGIADAGNASRFFKSIVYQSKASKKDRGEGNTHPTVKPTALMEYLIKMISREGSTILDPFLGSGSTGVAAVRSGRKFIGIELNPEYLEIAERRITNET